MATVGKVVVSVIVAVLMFAVVGGGLFAGASGILWIADRAPEGSGNVLRFILMAVDLVVLLGLLAIFTQGVYEALWK